MAYSEETVVDRMEVLENGVIQVRKATRVKKDGAVIAQTYHRHVVCPDEDVTKEDTRVKAVADALWTQAVKDAYIASKI